MTVAELGARMPAAEFFEWQAFVRLEGEVREKARMKAEAERGARARTQRMRKGR